MSRSSPVPLQSRSQARAIFMPDTAKAVNRFPSGLSQDSIKAPVLMSPRLNDTSSMVHSRSPSWLTPAASFDGFSTDAHHHGSFTTAARGGLTPAPVCRCRRTYLHLCNSMVTVDRSVFYIRPLQLPSGHTNALAESVIGLYKTELFRRQGPWRTIDDLEIATLEWVDWYNHRRLHTACDNLPPAEYEALYYLQKEPATLAE
jgi:putative transposase